MIFHKSMKAMVSLSDGNTDFFNIVVEVLQGDALVPRTFTICQDFHISNVNISNLKKKWFHTKKKQGADNILQKVWWMQTTQMI